MNTLSPIGIEAVVEAAEDMGSSFDSFSDHNPMMSRCLKVLVVEDHPVVRLGLNSVIEAQWDMEVVGEADTVAGALLKAEKSRPDVAILALRLEGRLDGIELVREIKSIPVAPSVLVYTAFNSTDNVSACYLAGADGFVFKGSATGRLLSSIRSLRDGRHVWVTGRETEEDMRSLERAAEDSGLTQREQEVLGLMLQHFSNAEIADEIVVELSTVKTHVRSILNKLNLTSRRDLF